MIFIKVCMVCMFCLPSTVSMSFVSLFIILPGGVRSKKLIFEYKTVEFSWLNMEKLATKKPKKNKI